MKFCIFIVFLLVFSVNAAEDLGKSVFDMIRPKVFQVITSLSKDSPKQSYGSSFVVDKNGLLVTNYHVVSTALQDEDRKFKIYLIDGKNYIPAEVQAVDIVSDLAVIKVDKNFKSELKINPSGARQGETIFSLGLPEDINMTIVSGTFNNLVKYGPYERIHMSSPINSGMSGGPTVNRKGEIVGVNVSVLRSSQNISFSVPATRIIRLLEEHRKSPQGPIDSKIDEIVRNQLANIEKELLEDMKKNAKQNNKIGKWSFSPPSSSLKCWANKEANEKKNYEIEYQECDLPESAFIGDNISSGSYEIDFSLIKNLKLNLTQYFNKIQHHYSGMKSFYQKKITTAFDCHHMIIASEDNIAIKVNYCLNAYVKYPGVYNAVVKGTTLEKKSNENMIFYFTINGFSKQGIMDFISYQIANIRFKRD